MKVLVRYFASLRDAAGVAEEHVESNAVDLAALYGELQARHAFTLPVDRLRAALDGEFVRWDTPLRDGAQVVFLPPVSGG